MENYIWESFNQRIKVIISGTDYLFGQHLVSDFTFFVNSEHKEKFYEDKKVLKLHSSWSCMLWVLGGAAPRPFT